MGFFGGGGGTTPVNMVGASSGTAGTAGYVPAPAAGEQEKTLAGSATFVTRDLVQIPKTLSSGSYLFNPSGCDDISSNRGFGIFQAIRFNAVYIPQRSTFSDIACYYVSGGGSNAKIRMAVYDSDGTNGFPLTLLCQTTEASKPASAGLISQPISGGNYTFNKGIYWGAIWFNADSTSINFYGPIKPAMNLYSSNLLLSTGGSTYKTDYMLRLTSNYDSNGYPSTVSVSTSNIVGAQEAPSLFFKYA
jgi:hypothetical protein